MAGLTIISDTRQQAGKHSLKEQQWAAQGVALLRSKLPFGDYALPPAISVDTKRSIAELAQDVFQQHDRFKRELVAANEAGCLLVILVENDYGVRCLSDLANWMEPEADFRKRRGAKVRISGARLAKACATMESRYGARFEFCRPSEAAGRVIEILTEG